MSVLASLTNCKILSTIKQEEDYEGWKAARSRGVGGSEVGAICGVSNYATARTIYLRKTQQYDEDFSDDMKERMQWGHLLEPIVASRYETITGKRVVESPATLCHKDHTWAIANVDRFIVDEHGAPYGILECKTTDARNWQEWDEGEPPIYYLYQLQWYLWVTGLKYGALACLVGGNKFYYFELFINDELLEQDIVPKVNHFWNHNVKNLIEPALTGANADTELVKEQYTDVVKNSEMVLPDEEANDLAEFIVMGKAQLKELESKVDEACNRLKDRLKNTEIGYTTDRVIKWSPRSASRVNVETLKLDFPEVYERCKKVSHYRVFTVR